MTRTLCGSLRLHWPPHAAHHQLHCFSRAASRPTKCSPQRGNRRQWRHTYDIVAPPCLFSCHDDPPQEVRALLHNLLRKAPALVVVLLRLLIALLQQYHHPRDLGALFSSILTNHPHGPLRSRVAQHVLASPQKGQLFIVWRFIDPRCTQTLCIRGFFLTSSLRNPSWQRGSPGPSPSSTLPLVAVYLRLLLVLPQIVTTYLHWFIV